MGVILTAAAMAADNTFGPQFLDRVDFTLFFEHIMLTIAPSSLFILALPWYIYFHLRKASVVGTGLLLWAKLATAQALVGCELAITICWAQQHLYESQTAVAASALACIGSAALGLFLYVEHCHTIRSSGIVAVYLVATIAFDGAKARTNLTRTSLTTIGALYIASIALKTALVILGEFPKTALIKNPKTRRNINPEATSGFWNRVFFFWINRTMWTGFKSFLHLEDLPSLEDEFSSDLLHARFHARWKKANHSNPNSLVATSFFTFWRSHAAVILPRLLLSAFSFVQPFVLEATVRSLGTSNASNGERFWLVLATAIVYSGIAGTKALSEHFINRSITLVRGALNAELLDKSLKLTFKQAKESAAVSLMSADVEGLFDSVHTLHRIWSGIIDMGVGFYLLTRLIKQSSFLGALPSLLAFLITLQVGVYVVPATRIWNESLQLRISETIKFLAQLKAVKMTGRSPVMMEYIQGLRRTEIKRSVYKRQLWIIVHTITTTAESAVPIALLAGGVFWSGFVGGFNSASVFSILTIVTIILEPLATFPTIIPDFAAALACFRRLQEFLLLPERRDKRIIGTQTCTTSPAPENSFHDENCIHGPSEKPNEVFPSDCAVAFRDVTLTYDEKKPPILKDINLSILKAELSVIVGPVASGKTSLMEAILGEVEHRLGSIYVHDDKMAYCSQTPFIQNVSIQKNIIGFRPLNVPWYNSIIDACELREDLKQMKDGDQSLAGSGGVRLSGGQKQRIAAAQAAYALTEIIVLDNPFSALDAKTSRRVFSNLFAKDTGLLRKRGITVILSTQTVEFFSSADRIHVLNGQGGIRTCDNVADLVEFSRSIPHFNLISADTGKKENRGLRNDASKESSIVSAPEDESDGETAVDHDLTDPDLMSRKLGDWGSYAFLLKAIPLNIYLVWASVNVVVALFERSTDIYVRVWLDKAPDNKWYFFGLVIALVIFFVTHTGWYWHFYSSLVPHLSINLHETLLETITRADLTFITSKDNGSILNRFSQDMTYVNFQLPAALLQVAFLSVAVLISLGIIASGVSYTAAIIPGFMVAIYVVVRFYLRTSRQMRYLDLEGKTPLFTHFTETTAGLRHIRSLGRQEDVLRQGLRKLDTAQKPYYYMLCIQRWLTLSLDMLVLAIAVLLEAMALRFVGQTSENGLGLSLLSLVGFALQMQRCFVAWTLLENSLGVVSRLRALVENAPLEAKISPPYDLPPNWPQHGKIGFKNVTLAYSLPGKPAIPVLEDVRCSIFPGARVAATGRTGSGKSSFILALLNLIGRKGTIDIDGYDPKELPPDLLRSRITTIPQDPAQLPGTVRDNLIPADLVDRAETSQMDDAALISILNSLFIWEHIRLTGGLDKSYNDMSFSHGQRQLVALAGAVIHNKLMETKLVIMDEATSHLDYNTDDKVQAYLTSAFGNSTVICVNHRDKGFPKPDITLLFTGGRLDDVLYHSELADEEETQDQERINQEKHAGTGEVEETDEVTDLGGSQKPDEQSEQPSTRKEEDQEKK